MASVSTINLLRRARAPRGPYDAIAKQVLPGWEVSLAFFTPRRARALNKKLRGKDYVPNVLSYAIGKKSGEIIICPAEAARQAPDFRLPASWLCLLLFIHGLLHLEGRTHGGTMEAREQSLLARYLPAQASAGDSSRLHTRHHEATHRDRHRHRHIPGQAGYRRRIR